MYALAVTLHTIWDGLGGRITYAAVGAVSIGLLLLGLRHARKQDDRLPG
jgi:protease PrsW